MYVSAEKKKEHRRNRKSPYFYYVQHYRFSSDPIDNTDYYIEVNKTTFGKRQTDREMDKIPICIDPDREMVAVDIQWHKTSNIIWITVWSTVLILTILAIWGTFNNVIKRIFWKHLIENNNIDDFIKKEIDNKD